MNYLLEQQEWSDRVADFSGADSTLISVSSHSSDIRVYANGDTVVKMRRLTPASVQGRQNSLEGEFSILRSLEGIGDDRLVLPKAQRYLYADGWEMVEMCRVAPPFVSDPVVAPGADRLRDLLALGRGVVRLNRRGVSHGDLVRGNAGLDASGNFVILDFDQAIIGSPFRCFLRDFFGVPLCRVGSQFTVMSRLARHPTFSPLRILFRHLRSKRFKSRSDENVLFQASFRNDPSLSLLAQVWKRAATSGANSPERPDAYYSLDVNGVHFPGERPWVLRWDKISRGVSFAGKSVVELGSNLALLSIHALLAGAKAATAADGNSEIIGAASMAAKAFGVNLTLHTVNFDEDTDWESRVGSGDIVTVLSLTHWLKDPDRLWRYVGEFKEIIFEGHESPEETTTRLKKAGFTTIRELGLSDRTRPLFHASRE